jgi:hypothetical protein
VAGVKSKEDVRLAAAPAEARAGGEDTEEKSLFEVGELGHMLSLHRGVSRATLRLLDGRSPRH